MPAIPSSEIIDACRALGFALAGVCRAEPSSFAPHFDQWLAEGRHGQMEWLRETAAIRKNIDEFLPGAKSIVMVADQYAAPGSDRAPRGSGGWPDARANVLTSTPNDPVASNPSGRIARYARGRDYHKVMSRRIHRVVDQLRERHPGERFRSFVDAAPVMEREHALRAGLGWIGKNTMLIHPRLGSYLLLGGFATTLDIEPTNAPENPATPPGNIPAFPDYCGTCTRCIDACPTQAITERRVDAARCISYLTLEHAGPIDESLAPKMGDWILGCDICQEVCPFNAPDRGQDGPIRAAANPAYAHDQVVSLPLLEVVHWTAEDRAHRMTGSAMKRATLDMLKRNAAIALQNAHHVVRSRDPE